MFNLGDCQLKFQNVLFPDHVGFECKGCGRCCKEQPADLTAEEIQRLQEKGYADFLDETDLSEPRLIRRKNFGGCFFLSSTSGCEIQDLKPAICRIVPFVVIDWDYVTDLIEVDLPADCDCPGICIGEQLPIETIGKAAQIYVHDLQSSVAKKEKLPPIDPKVLSKTRQLIIKLATDYSE